MLSVLIPIFNEENNVEPLAAQLLATLGKLGQPFEIIYINDGSVDGTRAKVDALAAGNPAIKVIHLARNYGQTTAIMAGIDYSKGDIIIPIDGDLQNDAEDIPRLLDKMGEGYDVVSGWRVDRADASLTRDLPSRLANKLISLVSGVKLHDYGCSLKTYRRRVIEGVRLYGEMHRFIPIYASWQGGRITEIPVRHHARVHGRSNYGLERTLKVLLDLFVVKFLGGHLTKPIYVFGGFGFLCVIGSFVVGIFTLYLKFFEGISLIQTPLLLLAVMMFITGVMSMLMGILAEVLVRIYFESGGKKPYLVSETLNLPG